MSGLITMSGLSVEWTENRQPVHSGIQSIRGQQSVSTSIRQYINTSIHQYINTSIHQYINTSVFPYVSTSVRSCVWLFSHSDVHTVIHPYFRLFRHTSEWTAVVPTFNTHRNTFIHLSTRKEVWTYCHNHDRMEVQPGVCSSLLSYLSPHDLSAIRMTFSTSFRRSGWPAVWLTGTAIITTVIQKKIYSFPKVPTIADRLPAISTLGKPTASDIVTQIHTTHSSNTLFSRAG